MVEPIFKAIFTLILYLLFYCGGLLICIAYYTLAERRIMAGIQRRKGPNVVGFSGLLQPIADGLKLLVKEIIIPVKANRSLFLFAPLYGLALSLLAFSVLPISTQNHYSWLNVQYPLLFYIAILSLSIYSVILGGWASNSVYGLLGSLRAISQMISFELPITLIISIIGLTTGNLTFVKIIQKQQHVWYYFLFFPLAVIFYICVLAETNRTPFDLPEAEAEIVAGYNIEYSSIIFSMFFLSEYAHMLLASYLFTFLFLGGWLPLFSIFEGIPGFIWLNFKVLFIATSFIVMRSILPRYRYDQLMEMCWKIFIPITLAYLFLVIGSLAHYLPIV